MISICPLNFFIPVYIPHSWLLELGASGACLLSEVISFNRDSSDGGNGKKNSADMSANTSSKEPN